MSWLQRTFFFLSQMDLSVPNAASSRLLLMWANFPATPRKNTFPVSPGTDRGVLNRIKQVSLENIWSLLRSQVALIAFLSRVLSVFA